MDGRPEPEPRAPSSLVTPILSVVIAVFNEAENVGAVVAELTSALASTGPSEIVFVDDGSTDGTPEALAACGNGQVRVLRHDRRCGKTAALRTGIGAARADWIGTMDGDGQNDPRDLVALLALGRAASGNAAPLVAGVRLRRHDGLSRRLATRFANGFRQAVLADHCPDSGCGLKAFRRADFLRLPAFEGMHRFLPALFQLYGHPLVCHPVTHRPRMKGRSKYTNWGRALVGVGDMLGVIWLRSRTHVPGRVSER